MSTTKLRDVKVDRPTRARRHRHPPKRCRVTSPDRVKPSDRPQRGRRGPPLRLPYNPSRLRHSIAQRRPSRQARAGSGQASSSRNLSSCLADRPHRRRSRAVRFDTTFLYRRASFRRASCWSSVSKSHGAKTSWGDRVEGSTATRGKVEPTASTTTLRTSRIRHHLRDHTSLRPLRNRASKAPGHLPPLPLLDRRGGQQRTPPSSLPFPRNETTPSSLTPLATSSPVRHRPAPDLLQNKRTSPIGPAEFSHCSEALHRPRRRRVRP